MIWPFGKKRHHIDKVGPVRSQPHVPVPKRTWHLLQVEPALACNLACIMCPWRGESGRSDGSGLMDQRVWAAVKPWLREVEMVDFTGGGEPLLQPRLHRWIRDAADAGCRAGFLTNGTLLTSDLTRQLVDAGLDWIGFSMDGATAEVYEAIRPGADFKRVCAAIAEISRLKPDHRPRIILNFVMMTVNVHQLADLVRLAADLGVDRINFKQCDMIRAVNQQAFGLFGQRREKRIISFIKLEETFQAAKNAMPPAAQGCRMCHYLYNV